MRSLGTVARCVRSGSAVPVGSDSAARLSVSSNPLVAAGDGTGSSAFVRSPFFTASRQPRRFPLSTVETYSGGSGRSVVVSYQFKK